MLVSARLLESERLLQVAVKDTGIGISPERQSHLFAPFTQADTSINRRYGGTGLGLAICRRLVEMLGGSISVQSEEGQGSTFTFTVSTGPLDEVPLQEEAVPPPVVALPPLSRLDGKRVLIVDDRRDMRYLIQTYVEEAGASAESASDGALAVERVKQAQAQGEPFDAIVLDMQMPIMDGFRAAPELRAAGHTGFIVALTANAMKGDAERCLSVGCDEYLSKPVDRLRLLYLLTRGRGEGKLASAQPQTNAEGPVTPPAPAQTFQQRVLIVDDNPDATELLAILLASHELEAITAKSGAEAVERARATRPHVVLLDLGLPDMDGYAVLEHLQAIEDLRGTRFIALTGRSMPEDKQRMKEAGFHHQLVKPPDLQQLIELIKGVR